MKSCIRKIGNSAGAILPAVLLKKLNLAEGAAIEIIEDRNRLIITPFKSKLKYKLADLLEQCDENIPMPKEVKEWDEAAAMGDEVL